MFSEPLHHWLSFSFPVCSPVSMGVPESSRSFSTLNRWGNLSRSNSPDLAVTLVKQSTSSSWGNVKLKVREKFTHHMSTPLLETLQFSLMSLT